MCGICGSFVRLPAVFASRSASSLVRGFRTPVTPHVSTTLLRTQTDERLVLLATAGHDRAFEAIVDRYRRPMMRYAKRFLAEPRAEDIVQAAFVSAWAALRDGIEVRDLRPWLYRIVHNGALNAMKKAGSDDAQLVETSATLAGPEAEVEQREEMRRTLDGIASLPDRQRAALLAVAVDGRSHADIGAELGLNDTAVRQLVRRARLTLRAAATAVTPLPLATWLAGGGAPWHEDASARVAELVGAGAASGSLAGGVMLKTGAVIATVGAIAVGTPKVAQVVRHHELPGASAAGTSGRGQDGDRSSLRAPEPGGATPAVAVGTSDDRDRSTNSNAGDAPRSDHSERRDSSANSGPSGKDRRGTGGARQRTATVVDDSEDDHSGSGRSGGDDRGEHKSRHRRGKDGKGRVTATARAATSRPPTPAPAPASTTSPRAATAPGTIPAARTAPGRARPTTRPPATTPRTATRRARARRPRPRRRRRPRSNRHQRRTRRPRHRTLNRAGDFSPARASRSRGPVVTACDPYGQGVSSRPCPAPPASSSSP